MKIGLQSIVQEALVFDLWVIIAHLLAVIILLSVITFFAWKPTKEYLEKRKKKIQEEIDNIENSKMLAEENLIKSNELKNKSIDEANKILELAEMNAYDLKEKIKNEANIDAKYIKEMAKNDILKKEKQLKENIESEISNLAIQVAEVLVKKKMDKEINQKLIDSIIEDIKRS